MKSRAEEMNAQLTALQQMVRSDGWKLFEQMLAHAEGSAFQHMSQSKESFEHAKHFGAYFATKNFRSWPERQIQALAEAIRSEVNSK